MPVSRVISRNRPIIRVLIAPGFPVPIVRPSALITGIISAAVPVRKHSSAMKTSCRVIFDLGNLDSKLRRNLEDDRACDSTQGASGDRWRKDMAMLDDEKVVSRAFRNIARVVQHERLVRAGEVRFDSRHHVVQVIERLNRGIEGGRAVRAVAQVTTVSPFCKRPRDKARWSSR